MLDRNRACGGSAYKFDRLLISQGKLDEILRVEYLQRKPFCRERCLKWKGKVQNQRFTLVFEIIVDRGGKLLLFAVNVGEGEVVELSQRVHVRLRQRRKFFAAVNTLDLGVDSLKRVGRKHVIEGPGVADALN